MKVLIVVLLAACAAGAACAEENVNGGAKDEAPNVAAGEVAFKKCLPCHSVGAGARNKFGPQLNGLDGRMSGTAAGYSFSAPYRSAGIIWNEAIFAAYMKDPQVVIPGAKMTFRGNKDETEVRNLWAYLAQFNDDGAKQ